MDHLQENPNKIALSDLHNIAASYNTTTMHIINLLEPIAMKLSKFEQYDELQALNKVAANCYKMLKLSFCLSEFRMVKEKRLILNMQNIALNSFLQERFDAIKLILSNTGYTLTYTLCDEIVALEFDERYFAITLFLLVSKACSTSPVGSNISACLNKTQSNVVITITDEGDGMSLEDIHAQLNWFSTSDTESIDLSLSLANEIVSAMGGNILISSKLNTGTTTTITFPLIRSKPQSLVLNSSTKRYLTNRYSDMHIIFSGICEPTFF